MIDGGRGVTYYGNTVNKFKRKAKQKQNKNITENIKHIIILQKTSTFKKKLHVLFCLRFYYFISVHRRKDDYDCTLRLEER